MVRVSDDSYKDLQVPIRLRNKLIEKLTDLIYLLKENLNIQTIYHLKKEIRKTDLEEQILTQFQKIITEFHSRFNLSFIINNFNILLDILDYLTGGNLTVIANKNDRSAEYVRELAKLIFIKREQFTKRFRFSGPKTLREINKRIKNYAQKIGLGEMGIDDFSNLTNQQFQIIKEFYREKAGLKSSERIKSLFEGLRIQPNFINFIESIKNDSYDEIIQKTSHKPLSKNDLISLCERINYNDEILKFITYSMISNPNLSNKEISSVAGTSLGTIVRYRQKLAKMKDPKTKKSYIDNYLKTTKFKGAKKFHLERKEYFIVLPLAKRTSLIKDLNEIIEGYKIEYKYEFLLKDLMELPRDEKEIKREDLNPLLIVANAKARGYSDLLKDKNEIVGKLKKIATKYFKADFLYTKGLFTVLLDIKDFLLGGSAPEIAEKNNKSRSFIIRLAKDFYHNILKNKALYELRFYYSRKFKSNVLNVAENYTTNKIDKRSFRHLINLDVQELMKEYRYSQGFTRETSLFRGMGTGLEFPIWVKKLDQKSIDQIVRKKIPKITILNTCIEINMNWEVLNYVIFAIMNTTEQRIEIAESSGKNADFVSRCAKILESNYSPSNGRFFLKSYKERFPKGRIS